MLQLFRAEWLKLIKRPMTWILLAIFLALLVLQLASQFFIAHLASALGVDSGTSAPLEVQQAEWLRRTSFPGLFGSVFSHINGLGAIFAVIMAAGSLGSEYSWGTLRTHLARNPNRTSFFLAKLLALLALLVVGMVISLLVGSVVGMLLGLLVGGVNWPSLGDLALLPLAILRALYVLLPYVLLTLCFTVLGRSLLVGVAGGLLYLVADIGFGTLATLQMLGGLWQQIYNLTIQQNINTLVVQNSHAFGLRPELLTPLDLASMPAPWLAVLIIAVYCVSFLATAIYLLRKRDVAGAG